MLQTPIEQLAASVAPSGCRVINLPKRVWVFGGTLAADSTHRSESLRDSFWRQQLRTFQGREWFEHLDRPENHPGWWAFSGYDNLLEFERDACYLASQTIVFSESPGSLAELGALTADDFILPKLLVVVQQKYLEDAERQSFLNLGPLRRAELLRRKCVIASPNSCDLLEDDFDAVVESFDSAFGPLQPRRVDLNADDPMHRLLLIADLVDLFLVSKVADIKAALEHFHVHLRLEQLERSLKLLDFFGLVRQEMRGTEPFWVRLKSSDAPWIDYTSVTPHVPFDRQRFKIEWQAILVADKRRNSIFQRQAA